MEMAGREFLRNKESVKRVGKVGEMWEASGENS
jgi:hypothetical protein